MTSKHTKVAVCGAGGQLGASLTGQLIARDFEVTAVDLKPLPSWVRLHPQAHNIRLDLRLRESCERLVHQADTIVNLTSAERQETGSAAEKTASMLRILIDTHLLLAANESKTASYIQLRPFESLEQPASTTLLDIDPEDLQGYFSACLCRQFRQMLHTKTVSMYHRDLFGSVGGNWAEPAGLDSTMSICRKIARARTLRIPQVILSAQPEQDLRPLFAEDVASALSMAVEHGCAATTVVEGGEVITNAELVQTLKTLIGYNGEVLFVEPAAPIRTVAPDPDQVLTCPSTLGLADSLGVTMQRLMAEIASASPGAADAAA